MVSRGWVCVSEGRMGRKVSYLWYLCQEGFVVAVFCAYCSGGGGCMMHLSRDTHEPMVKRRVRLGEGRGEWVPYMCE